MSTKNVNLTEKEIGEISSLTLKIKKKEMKIIDFESHVKKLREYINSAEEEISLIRSGDREKRKILELKRKLEEKLEKLNKEIGE